MKIVNTHVRSFRGALIASDTNFHFEDIGVRIMNLRNHLMAVAAVSLLALGSNPHAATISNHQGAICQHYYAFEATKIDYSVSGVESLTSSPTTVICPLVRATTNTAGATAYVGIKLGSSTGSASCSFHSHDYDGQPLGMVSGQTVTGLGYHDIVMTLGAGKSSYWGNYTVQCSIPGQLGGKLIGIELVEY
ncbi:MAG: hypothetical protein ACRERU_07785 [Methylococcales bacterium]